MINEFGRGEGVAVCSRLRTGNESGIRKIEGEMHPRGGGRKMEVLDGQRDSVQCWRREISSFMCFVREWHTTKDLTGHDVVCRCAVP